MPQCEDENGIPYGLKHIGNKVRVSAMPYLYDIAEGNVDDHASTHILGHNDDIDNAVEDIWEPGGSYTFPSSAMQMEVVSSDAEDTAAGPGARTVMIHYLDSNYDEQTEVLIDGLMSLLEPIMILVLGGVVMVIVMAIFLPMIGIITNLSAT